MNEITNAWKVFFTDANASIDAKYLIATFFFMFCLLMLLLFIKGLRNKKLLELGAKPHVTQWKSKYPDPYEYKEKHGHMNCIYCGSTFIKSWGEWSKFDNSRDYYCGKCNSLLYRTWR